jgi:hypothetical protein
MPDSDAIAKAISDLKSGKAATIQAAADLHGLDRSTLSRRYNGKTIDRVESNILHHQLLSPTQEDGLIDYINKLNDRGLPPTPQMLENFVVEIVGHPIRKNWTTEFIRRHSERIKSQYLKGIDRARQIAESAVHFTDFYARVSP